MKPSNLIASAILATAGFMAPSISMAGTPISIDLQLPSDQSAPSFLQNDSDIELVRQGRGRGRGGDRDRDDDRDDDRNDDRGGRDDRDGDRSSGRDRPRIPGGSGCDDPLDLIEHPECRV